MGIKDPYSIILAADHRISHVDYPNHQTWKLDLGLNEPLSIQLSTTFGFRAQNMRIFPQFTENFVTKLDPSIFIKPPQIEFFAPNFVSLNFEPFLGISVNQDILIPDSQTIAGKFGIRNTGGKTRSITFDLAALLNPALDGQTIQPIKKEISSVLSGKTGDLHPLLFMTRGAEGTGSPYPSLRHSLILEPGEHREFSWSMASLKDQNLSFQHARKMTTRNWKAEIQKIKMLDRRSVEIKTGDINWDSAFAFSQSIAKSLLLTRNEHFPYPSFVQILHPDFGYSSTDDGMDYGDLWNGQSIFDVWHLSKILLPSEPEMIKGFLHNFISTQKDDGLIDGNPGPIGQRQNQLAAPLLAQIALDVFKVDSDQEFLDNIYDPLLAFFFRWFDSETRSGELKIPVWKNIMQTNFEYNPIYSHWEINGQGVDIQKLVSPDLLTYLYRESQALQDISGIIGKSTSNLENYQRSLEVWLQHSWNRKLGKFRYLDIESLTSQRGKKIFSTKENLKHEINYSSPEAERLLLQINTRGSSTSKISVEVKGLDQNKKKTSLTIESNDIHWILGRGTFTFTSLLRDISSLKVKGLPDSGKVILRKVNHQQSDHNAFLPVWAGILSKAEISSMIKEQLSAGCPSLKANGIPALSKPLASFDSNLKSVYLAQNHMIIEGLYNSGYEKEAAEIFIRLMNSVSANLKKEKTFRRFYN
ncbi:MAG: hypothetical protein KAR20_11715, partial [Candidatus Heimdallarchaeota archaeon]|nr:hypothetical protein [Candidatus Heimdallarchaeota archaeon]